MTVKTKVRKGYLPKYEVIDDYLKGMTEEELADKYNAKLLTVTRCITDHIKAMSNLRETSLLVKSQNIPNGGSALRNVQKSIKVVRESSSINKSFLSLLSEPESPELSDRELHFILTYALTGDGVHALQESGLDAGLVKSSRGFEQAAQLKQCCRLRVEYLKRKKNVAAALEAERKIRYRDIVDDINREFVQLELLEQLDQLKQDPRKNASLIQKNLRLIGETIGAYVTNMKVSKIDPSQAMDDLIEMALDSDEEAYEPK